MHGTTVKRLRFSAPDTPDNKTRPSRHVARVDDPVPKARLFRGNAL
jgi:hypothetical protein